MKLIPAIDLYKGKVVRLYRGDYKKMRFYNLDLFEYLEILEKQGFRRIHIIDLYGAKKGKIYEIESLKQIRKNFNFNVQFGGGIRSLNTFNSLLNLCHFLIIGTKAFDKKFVKNIGNYKRRTIIALDVYKDRVFIKGWRKNSGVKFLDALSLFTEAGFKNFLITDIKKDGTMEGVDKNFVLSLKSKIGDKKINFYYAGGIKDERDINYLRESGIFKGAVCGKYLLEGVLKCLQKGL